jgi:nucleoside-diphosphate-sugar epimerase
VNILLTGASGFIGSSVLKVLSKKKNVKIFATYRNKKPKIFDNKNTKWIKFDIFKLNDFKFNLKKIDVVVHLAWPYLPDYTTENHLKKNLNVQKKFISKLVKFDVKNLFIASTCYEYGFKSGKLLESSIKKPNNSYAISKSLLREYVFNLNKNNKINLIWGRIFYVYGQNKKRDTLYNVVTNKNKRQEVKIANNFYRDYLDVNVLANLIVILSMLKKNIGEVNLCSGFSISLKRLVKFFFKINRIKDNVSSEKKVSDLEANNFYGDNKKLKNILDKNLRKNEYKKIINSMIKHKKL